MSPRPLRRILPVFLLAALLLAPPVHPQEQEKIRIEYEHPILDPEKGEFFLEGNVLFLGKDFELRADRVILWSREKTTQQPDEVYAEGNVRYRQGKETLRADALYYEFKTGKAYITEIRSRAPFPKMQQDVTLRAARVRAVAKGRMTAEDIRLSTCTYGIPHYDVHVGTALLQGRKERERKGVYDLFPYEEWSVSGSAFVPRYEGYPLLFLPGMTLHVPGMQDFPIRSVRSGRSSRYGYLLYVDWGLDLKKGMVDSLQPWDDSGTEDDDRKWGEVRLETDWRQRRGNASGLDLEWKWDGYSGYLDTYYLRDRGRNPDSSFDRKFPPLEDEDRGRLRLFHRHDIAEDWRYELELSYLSDEHLLEEFFPEEFKEGKEQETAAYLRFIDGNVGAYLLERNRLNDFQTQLEYLPKLESHLVAEPLLDLVYYSSRIQVAHLRQLYDEENNPGSERMWRIDLLNELRAPVDAKILVLSPYGALRTTIFEDDLQGETVVRRIWSAGGSVTGDVHGVHDLQWDLIGLRKLRHLVNVEARYSYNLRRSGDTDDLFLFDEVDRQDEFEEAAFVLRNRFQTKGDDGKTNEFLTVGASIEYYPNLARDTVAPMESNTTPPFYWIGLAPGETGTFEERHWSNLHWEVDFRPRNIFFASARGEYNSEDRREEVREIQAGLSPASWCALSVTQTLVRDVSNAVSGGISWRPGEKWAVTGGLTYDFEREDYLIRRLVVGRDLHDFILEANFERDEARDETKLYVTFVPKFLGKRSRRSLVDLRPFGGSEENP